MPPTDFCSGASPEHTSELPKLHSSAAAANCCASGWLHPLRGSASRAVTGQGSLWPLGPFRPPSRRPLAALDLPQPDLPGHLLSRIRAELRLKAQRNSTAVR